MNRSDTSSIALIDALNNTFGRHSGLRASHAKGFCATGYFIPDRAAPGFVNNTIFREHDVSVAVRFSVAGGNPNASDKARSARGIGIRFTTGDESYDLIMLSEPVFFAATVDSFVSFLEARVPDPVSGKPDPAKIAAHNTAFPDGARQPAMLASHRAPASYATTPYFSNNAFLFTGAQGAERAARLILAPAAGTRHLSEQEEISLPDLFLEKEFDERLLRGPVGFTLQAILPANGDSLVDSSSEWKEDGRVVLGRLLVTALTGDDCDEMSFVPTNLPKNIALTDDPILKARKGAYAVSEARRALTRQLGD